MEMTLGKWMGVAITATTIAILVWNVLFGQMSDIANAVANLMNGGTTP
ncbi:MAG: hypothetical protein R3267_02375 [Paenisporosarcina sp.]|nr:hypothetical protein [Paenisporosarcina sp.]